MDSSSQSDSTRKLEECLSSSWTAINKELKTYYSLSDQGLDCLNLIISHKTSLKTAEVANLAGTELSKQDPDCKKKLRTCILRELASEETCLRNILGSLQSSFSSVMVQVDKVLNTYKSCRRSLSMVELTSRNEQSVSLLEKLQPLEDFKILFSEDHTNRKWTLDVLVYSDDYEKIKDLWDVSSIKNLQTKMNWLFGIEDGVSLSDKTIVLLSSKKTQS